MMYMLYRTKVPIDPVTDHKSLPLYLPSTDPWCVITAIPDSNHSRYGPFPLWASRYGPHGGCYGSPRLVIMVHLEKSLWST